MVAGSGGHPSVVSSIVSGGNAIKGLVDQDAEDGDVGAVVDVATGGFVKPGAIVTSFAHVSVPHLGKGTSDFGGPDVSVFSIEYNAGEEVCVTQTVHLLSLDSESASVINGLPIVVLGRKKAELIVTHDVEFGGVKNGGVGGGLRVFGCAACAFNCCLGCVRRVEDGRLGSTTGAAFAFIPEAVAGNAEQWPGLKELDEGVVGKSSRHVTAFRTQYVQVLGIVKTRRVAKPDVVVSV
jgi:hypothetical protein